MVKGKYYYVWDDSYSGCMIGKCLDKSETEDEYKRCKADFIITFLGQNNLNINSIWCYKATNRYYREATTDEIEWLELCIKETRFVKKPKIKIYELW